MDSWRVWTSSCASLYALEEVSLDLANMSNMLDVSHSPLMPADHDLDCYSCLAVLLDFAPACQHWLCCSTLGVRGCSSLCPEEHGVLLVPFACTFSQQCLICMERASIGIAIAVQGPFYCILLSP